MIFVIHSVCWRYEICTVVVFLFGVEWRRGLRVIAFIRRWQGLWRRRCFAWSLYSNLGLSLGPFVYFPGRKLVQRKLAKVTIGRDLTLVPSVQQGYWHRDELASLPIS